MKVSIVLCSIAASSVLVAVNAQQFFDGPFVRGPRFPPDEEFHRMHFRPNRARRFGDRKFFGFSRGRALTSGLESSSAIAKPANAHRSPVPKHPPSVKKGGLPHKKRGRAEEIRQKILKDREMKPKGAEKKQKMETKKTSPKFTKHGHKNKIKNHSSEHSVEGKRPTADTHTDSTDRNYSLADRLKAKNKLLEELDRHLSKKEKLDLNKSYNYILQGGNYIQE